ncbi:Golgin subfamily A member 7/ERF4 family-domain-containing protein [Gautieria morchelliformis]|nr:Golgin subfamily A member 7/ERF4 family-domain-containing protein [Gautieria morchelliformis]
MMPSPLQVVTAHAAPAPASTSTTSTPSTPHPHAEDNDTQENLHVPVTPSSSFTSAASSSRCRPQHRKASSLSTPAALSRPNSHAHAHARSLSAQILPPSPTEPRAPLVSPHAREANAKGDGVMITPPDALPPSPPLTSHESDGDVDEDSEEVAPAESASERQEEDITEAWRGDRAEPRQSRETAREHPLGSPGDARLDLDLERGLEHPMSHKRGRPSAEADILQQAGVTKPFEIIRRPKRTGSPKPPHSSYYIGPPTGASAYATPPCGQMGVHYPREIIRVERDYDHGELVQFSTSYPLELGGRITPTQFLETINALNEGLIRAHSLSGACLDNALAFLTLWISTLFMESTYDREMRRLQELVDAFNAELYNTQGLNILWPRKSAFLFLEIEYY